MHTVLRRIVVLVVLLVVLVSGTAPTSWAAEKVTVGIGGVALMVYLPTALAKSKGYFAEEGLDVEILDIKGGGSQAASALIGGSVDFSANAIDHAIKAKVQKKDLVAIHSHVRLAMMGLVVANKYKGEIKSIADLKGRPLGVTSPGSQTHMVLGFLLARNGLKADDVKIIGAGGNTMPLAIEKDSVHAGMMLDPFFTVFLKQGKGYALVDMFTMKGTVDAMGGEVQGTTLLTRPDVIAKRPATVQKMVNALVKANKFITSSSGEELAKSLPKELAGDPKLYAESFEHAREGFPPDSLISREGVARVIETMRVFEAVPAGLKIEPESLFDNRYVLKALGRKSRVTNREAALTTRSVGARILRNEDSRMLLGLSCFVDDVNPPGVLHAALLRSPHAHARSVRIDDADARRVPGV